MLCLLLYFLASASAALHIGIDMTALYWLIASLIYILVIVAIVRIVRGGSQRSIERKVGR